MSDSSPKMEVGESSCHSPSKIYVPLDGDDDMFYLFDGKSFVTQSVAFGFNLEPNPEDYAHQNQGNEHTSPENTQGTSFRTFFKTSGEEQEKAKGEILEILKTIEEQSGIGENKNKFFGGDKINAVDLAFAFIAHWIGPMEEVAAVKLLEEHKFPKLYAWTERFKQISVIKNNLPDYNELVGFFKHVKEHGYLKPPK